MKQRVLMIVTSHAQLGDTGKATGVWVEELSAPYYAFLDAGIEVVLTTPKGGKIPFDPNSLQNESSVERFLADTNAMRQAQNTAAVATINATDFDAVFFPGGHGAMWDLPHDDGVTRAVEAAFAANKIIAAVCHGLAGLVSTKRADGQSILLGKRVNGFTDAEEIAAGMDAVVPFKLETRLRELGGIFEGGDLWQPYAVHDGQLITGQNPASSQLVAQHILQALTA